MAESRPGPRSGPDRGPRDERHLEAVLRAGLHDLAGEADVAVPLAGRARAAVVRRRRRSVLVAGAAAAAVLAVVVGTLVATSGSDRTSPPVTPATTATSTMPPVPIDRRLEVWHSLGVFVPSDWGWGAAPTDVDGSGELSLCPAGAAVLALADRPANPDPSVPYVGRPGAQSDVCGPVNATPTAPYVWLGADLPAGTTDLGHGWVRQTERVAGTTLTVASRSPQERRTILSSAFRIPDSPCAPRLATPPSTASTGGASTAGASASAGDGRFDPDSMVVCAYSADYADGSGGTVSGYDLLAEETLPADRAAAFLTGVEKAPPLGEFSCVGASGGDWALLRVEGADGRRIDYVADLNCPGITGPTGIQHALNRADVTPWLVGGVNEALLHTGGAKSPLGDAIR